MIDVKPNCKVALEAKTDTAVVPATNFIGERGGASEPRDNFATGANSRANPVVSDFPTPAAATDHSPLIWDVDQPASQNYPQFALRLQQAGDLYRRPGYASGLLLASQCPDIPPTEIMNGGDLSPIVTDRLNVIVTKDKKPRGNSIPVSTLSNMLQTELFLGQFRPVDRVVKRPMFVGDDFALTVPGYNDYGRLNRVYYVGDVLANTPGCDTIKRFLDVMAFAADADRTNAVGAALSVLLRNYFPGAKPIVVVTSTKSHGGKETIVEFTSSHTRKSSISYETADWALEKAFVDAVKFDPEIGVVNVENVRQAGGSREISSAFLERLLTDPEPLLNAPGTGKAIRRANHFVITMTTNNGNVSTDLLNRALPIHLAPVGDIASRTSPIGNPKLEFLPANRDGIEAELRGMVEKWKHAGMPLDLNVKHPFNRWAGVVGGILMVNGFTDFLGNYGLRKTVDDPVRKALGLLGAHRPSEWLTATDWVPMVAFLGLTNDLISKADRESDESRSRGLGVVLSNHKEESFVVETEDATLRLKLEKARRRFDGREPHWRYRFEVLASEPAPEVDGETTQVK